jgi:hypothetical protein
MRYFNLQIPKFCGQIPKTFIKSQGSTKGHIMYGIRLHLKSSKGDKHLLDLTFTQIFHRCRMPYIIWPFVLPWDLINVLGICPLDFNTTRFRLYFLDIFRLPMEKTTGYYSNMSKFLSCTVQPCQRVWPSHKYSIDISYAVQNFPYLKCNLTIEISHSLPYQVFINKWSVHYFVK